MIAARRSGSHRAAPAPRPVRLGLSLLAIAVLAVLVAVALHMSPQLSDRTPDAQGTPRPLLTSASPGPEETGPEPTGQPTPSKPATSATPSPSASATSPSAQAARLPLLVLNNSRITGLATQAAAEFRRGGWTVRGTGNFRGRVAMTTVYYEPGQEASARRLAAEFGKVRRVAPRFAGLPGHGLTVVVTRDWNS